MIVAPPNSIAQTRRRLQLSQRQLGELVGVHEMTVSRWERGLLVPDRRQADLLTAANDAAARGAGPRVAEALCQAGALVALLLLLKAALEEP